MATSGSILGQGTQLKMGDGQSPENFTTIAEVTNLDPPSLNRDDLDVTNHDSTLGYREFKPGLRNPGEVGFSINWMPKNSTHDQTSGLLREFELDTIRNWKIVFPPAANATLNLKGYVREFTPHAPTDNVLTADVVIKVTERPVLS